MSFITKRERVFSEYNNSVSLPQRSEGKLKAYSSCTDTRAWSHFMSDKTEHLIEIIKRNNEACPGKYVPVGVIVEMMMAGKIAEISRLKRKITQLEQMLTAYDQLELSCDQKCEISTAHAMIRAANKSLEELPPLDLDVSGITEISDSEGFMTGQSGGDDGWSPRALKFKDSQSSPGLKLKDSKGSMKGSKDSREFKSDMVNSYVSTTDLANRGRSDVSTSIHDNRVDDMKEALISKDAKLNALQNTIAVMENDVCEPYCIYAHIYTALEKIYATLSQNDKYKLFLNLMSAGKDTRCLDIKGKILFKLKILEKFSIALLAPCSERFKYDESCACYYANVATSHVETTFALTSAETKPPDTKRAQLIADIMDNDEMKELLQKTSDTDKPDELPEDIFVTDTYSTIDGDNLSRLKNLQRNYEDLMAYYENVKHERDHLKIRCKKYEEMEDKYENLKVQLREYSTLYNERDYYRNRSVDLDSLKEQYLVLRDETAGLETQLKAEAEINSIKSNTIDDLRTSNISFEQRLNDASIAFEKEKNSILCKLKEAECKIMCQDQQIKSLTAQVDRLLAQDTNKSPEHVPHVAYVMDEIDDLKSQVKNLNDALYSSEDEKQQLQNQFETNIKLINDLRMDIENWKSEYEKARQRNEYLEKYSEGLKDDIRKLADDVDEKDAAVANLMSVIHNKSQEVNRLMENMEAARDENRNLTKNLEDLKDKYGCNVQELETEKNQVLGSLKLAKKESQDLLDKVKDFDELLRIKEDIDKKLIKQTDSCTELRNMLTYAKEENEKLLSELNSQENNTSLLLDEIQRLRNINNSMTNELKTLQSDKETLNQSYELKKKESNDLEDRFNELKNLQVKFRELSHAHEKLIEENNILSKELYDKAKDLDDAISTVELSKKESQNLLEKLEHSENLKEDMIALGKDYRKLSNDKQVLQNDLKRKTAELDKLAKTLADLTTQNDNLLRKSNKCDDLEKELADLKKLYDELSNEKAQLQMDFDTKTQEINALYNTLEEKIEENRSLIDQVKSLELDESETSRNLTRLQDMNANTQSMLSSLRKESKELLNKLKNYETLIKEHEALKFLNDGVRKENDTLLAYLEKLEADNRDLINQRGDILSENEKLEKALNDAREELIQINSQTPYADLLKEIQNMQMENSNNHLKIKELLEKLDETDNIICNLSEDVLARDDRIALQENQINSLEDEVRLLHQRLAEVLDTGEELTDNSIKKIDQTLNKIEAHHSKATHNMKMELAKLQNENSKLEEQLSITKIKSNESFQNTHKYVSQIIHLQNEREILVTDIKQLELSCVGDTRLSPSQCSIEDVLKSLDNIRKCVDARHSKSNSLEQTLLKVQTSSQLLLSKADEAKKLVEKEKQKIIKEKEQAIAEKLNVGQQLLDLKVQLEEQTSRDKKIIDDLERELLNQKLIIDKLNQQTQSYISNLEEELKSLKNIYQNSLDKINKLKDKTRNLKEENDKKDALINKINTDLQTKTKEIDKLQNDFNEFKNNPKYDRGTQVGNSSRTTNTKTQTDKHSVEPNQGDKLNNADEPTEIKGDSDIIMLEIKNILKDADSKLPHHKRALKLKGNETVNDMQILAANVEPNFDFMKSSYVDYKRKQLQAGKLENISISDAGVNNIENTTRATAGSSKNDTLNLDDMFNSESNEATTSSNMIPGQSYTTNDASRHNDSGQASDKSGPHKSKENDLFLIYKESESSHTDEKSFKDKGISSKQPAILVETVAVQPNTTYSQRKNPLSAYKERSSDQPDERLMLSQLMSPRFQSNIDDGKLQLDITLPRIGIVSSDALIDTTNSDSCIIYTHINQTVKSIKDETSDHLLTRVEADVLLLKNTDGDSEHRKTSKKRKLSQDFGLEYLLYSVKQAYDPQSLDPQSLRKTRSNSDSSTEKPNEQYLPCTSQTCVHYKAKNIKDQSIAVNLDATEYFEHKIQCLSQQLENTEKDYKKKIEAIKAQYDNNIRAIINDHNQGVNNIQDLHEETLQDIIKMHENEVESLRTMSIEATRRAEKLVKENKVLQLKLQDCCYLDEEPIRISSPETKRRRSRRHSDMKMLSKTKIEAFNVKPKVKQYGPCTCSLEVNVSDTIRNIFEQVDVEQRKLAERAYLKFIANKILSSNIESLDIQELSFLHIKVCRTWKNKICKDEALQKKMDTLESQLLVREHSRQQHIAELDRDLVEQQRRLTEARNALCSCSPSQSAAPSKFPRARSPEEYCQFPEHRRSPECRKSPNVSMASPTVEDNGVQVAEFTNTPMSAHTAFLLARATTCSQDVSEQYDVNERRSAGDLRPGCLESSHVPLNKSRRRTPLARQEAEERREKKMCEEPPTRLRRTHDGNSRSSRRC